MSGPAFYNQIDFITSEIDGGYEYTETVHNCQLYVTKIKQNGRGVVSELEIEIPNELELFGPITFPLQDHQFRQRLALDLAGRVIGDTPKPWDKILDYISTDAIRRYRSNVDIDKSPELRCMADIKPVDVRFMWYPYIPHGKLTIIEGDPGIGKSYAALAIATPLTNKGVYPGQDSPFDPHEKCNILLATGEDGAADTVRPRLDRLGADVSQVFFIDGLFTFDTSGIELLENNIQKCLPVLVIIDPLSAYLAGSVDIHKSNHVRQIMAQLSRIADDYAVTILAIRHLTKSASTKAIYRGAGSIDFTASARSVLSATRNDEGRGLVHIKSNLAPEGPAIGFEIRDGDFYWLPSCNLTKDDVMCNTDATQSAIQTAKSFLIEILDNAGPVDASEIFKEAKERDIYTATLYRAKSELNIKTQIEGNRSGKGGRGKSFWELEK